MKQAILMTAYKDLRPIMEIIELFDDTFHFHVHIDRKSRWDVAPLLRMDRVSVSRRYSVNWGGLNHMKAILLLAEEALKDPAVGFFHLITAEDFPVKPLQVFKDLDMTYNYLDHFPMPFAKWPGNGGMDRIDRYNPYDLFNAKNERQKRILDKLLGYQRRFGLKRSYPASFRGMKLYGGSTYWSLRRDALEHVVEFTHANRSFLSRFEHTFCAEELYVQTIIMNSVHAQQVIKDNLRYIDWDSKRGGRPAFLDETDLPAILASNKLFARKLNDTTSEPLKAMLREHLRKGGRYV